MSNKNRSIRIALTRIYGPGCMFLRSGAENYIEKLGNIKTYKTYKQSLHYKPKKIEVLEEIETLHHLQHKAEGGHTDIYNGAIINMLAHQYIHTLPRNQEELINDYIREWKKFFYKQVEIKQEEIEPLFEIKAAELVIDNKGTMTLKKLKDKEKRQEKRELQKIRKEWEDR